MPMSPKTPSRNRPKDKNAIPAPTADRGSKKPKTWYGATSSSSLWSKGRSKLWPKWWASSTKNKTNLWRRSTRLRESCRLMRRRSTRLKDPIPTTKMWSPTTKTGRPNFSPSSKAWKISYFAKTCKLRMRWTARKTKCSATSSTTKTNAPTTNSLKTESQNHRWFPSSTPPKLWGRYCKGTCAIWREWANRKWCCKWSIAWQCSGRLNCQCLNDITIVLI